MVLWCNSFNISTPAETQFIQKINAARVLPVKQDPLLVILARQYSEMLASGGPNAKLVHSDLTRLFSITAASTVGENLGVGHTVDSVHQAMLESPTHAAVIVNPVYSRVGVGIVELPDGSFFVTEIFANYGTVPE